MKDRKYRFVSHRKCYVHIIWTTFNRALLSARNTLAYYRTSKYRIHKTVLGSSEVWYSLRCRIRLQHIDIKPCMLDKHTTQKGTWCCAMCELIFLYAALLWADQVSGLWNLYDSAQFCRRPAEVKVRRERAELLALLYVYRLGQGWLTVLN